MTKHTPGPWYAHPLTLQVVDKKMWFDEYGARHGDTPTMVIDCNSLADTHLIASAPELLAALELAESAYRLNVVAEGEPSSILDAMQKAIAKAKGGAS